MWIVLALACVAGFLLVARRKSESRDPGELRDAGLRAGAGHEEGSESLEDSIDWDELNRAEDEVRGIDPMAKPEDGFEGDDWGPGTVPRPPQ